MKILVSILIVFLLCGCQIAKRAEPVPKTTDHGPRTTLPPIPTLTRKQQAAFERGATIPFVAPPPAQPILFVPGSNGFNYIIQSTPDFLTWVDEFTIPGNGPTNVALANNGIGQKFTRWKQIPVATGNLWIALQNSAGVDIAKSVAVDSAGNIIVTGNWNGGYIYIAKYSPTGDQIWWTTFAAAGVARDLAVDSAGNSYICGEYQGSVNFGGGFLPGNISTFSIYLVKVSPLGVHVWSKGFPGNNFGRSVTVDADSNVLLTGQFTSANFGCGQLTSPSSGSVFVSKFNSAGDCQWSTPFGGNQSSGIGIATDAGRNVFITGSCYGTTDFGGWGVTGLNDYCAFVAKLNSGGGYLWSKGTGAFQGNKYGGNGIAVGPNGDFAVTGNFIGTINFGNGPLVANQTTYLDTQVFFVRFANDGTPIWSRQVAGSVHTLDVGYDATMDAAGNSLFAGRIFGSGDFGSGVVSSTGLSTFAVKYSQSGGLLWAKEYSGNNEGNGIASAGAAALVAGWWTGAIQFGETIHNSTSGGTDQYLIRIQ